MIIFREKVYYNFCYLGAGGDVDVGLHGFVIGLGVSTHPQANTGTFHLFCQLSQRTHTD